MEPREELAAARAIKDEYQRARDLEYIAPRLKGELKTEAILLVREIKEEFFRARVLEALVQYLDDDFKAQSIREALAIARDIKDGYARTRALTALMHHLDDELKMQVFQETLTAIGEINDGFDRVQALTALAPQLDDKFKAQLIISTREIKDKDDRSHALVSLAPHLSGELKVQVFQEALGAILEIKNGHDRTRALINLAPHLDEGFKAQALMMFRGEIKGGNNHILISLAPYLNDELKIQALQEAFTAACEIENKENRKRAFSDLAPYLNEELKEQVITVASEIKDEFDYKNILADLAPYLNNVLKEQVLAAVHGNENRYTRVLTILAPHINNVLKEQALAAVRGNEDKYTHVLAILAPYLDGELKTQVFFTVREIKDENDRAHALASLAPYLNDELNLQALVITREIKGVAARARALAGLASHLNDKLKPLVLQEAITAVFEIKDKATRASTLESIARTLDHISRNINIDTRYDRMPSDPMMSSSKTNIDREMESNKYADEVSFTTYHPKEGCVESWHTLLVYAHILSALAKVQEDAKRFDNQIKFPKETRSKPPTPIVLRGTKLTILPSCEGVTFNPKSISFKWLEDFHRADFRFKADKSLSGDAAKGQITIYVGPLIIGTLKFAMLFNEKEDVQPVPDHEEHAKMYGKDDVFISYSRKDTEVARVFKTILAATGMDVFIDVDDLRSGQLWKDELLRRIERAGIFQMFWSENYSQSENCKMEWEYALKQNKEEGYIRPVYWKTPLSPKPPEELGKFNFQYVELSIITK